MHVMTNITAVACLVITLSAVSSQEGLVTEQRAVALQLPPHIGCWPMLHAVWCSGVMDIQTSDSLETSSSALTSQLFCTQSCEGLMHRYAWIAKQLEACEGCLAGQQKHSTAQHSKAHESKGDSRQEVTQAYGNSRATGCRCTNAAQHSTGNNLRIQELTEKTEPRDCKVPCLLRPLCCFAWLLVMDGDCT